MEAIVRRGVKLAFMKVKNLAKPSVFHKRVSREFSFDSDSSKSTTDVPLKIVQVSLKRNYKDKRIQIGTFLFDASELGDIRAYDKFTYEGKLWQLGSITEGSDFITLLEAETEAAA